MHSVLVKTVLTKISRIHLQGTRTFSCIQVPVVTMEKKPRRHVDFLEFTPSPDPLIFFDPFKVAGG